MSSLINMVIIFDICFKFIVRFSKFSTPLPMGSKFQMKTLIYKTKVAKIFYLTMPFITLSISISLQKLH